MENLRLFLGISLSDPVMGHLAAIMEKMTAKLPFRKWTHPADLHVTLHFLGDTPVSRMDALAVAAKRAAARTAPFELTLAEPGTFGSPQSPQVLWCSLIEPCAKGESDSLAALHGALAQPLAEAGFTLEARPFRAHATLARSGNEACSPFAIAAAWREALASELPDAAGISASLTWTVERFTLFRTILGRRPSYEGLIEFPLSGL